MGVMVMIVLVVLVSMDIFFISCKVFIVKWLEGFSRLSLFSTF